MKYIISTEYHAKSYDNRPLQQRHLVLHYTAGGLAGSLKELTGPKVSAHYLVPEGPIQDKRLVYQLVSEEKCAWTQGVSYWLGRNHLNNTSIGVEIVNLGCQDQQKKRNWFPYPTYQIETVAQLSKDIIQRYQIEATHVIGHSDVSPDRKLDPGPLFPWQHLYEVYKIGAWPDKNEVKKQENLLPNTPDIRSFQKDLQQYGYQVNTDGKWIPQTQWVVRAFQMHFRPAKYDGILDKQTSAILKALLKKYHATK